MKLRRIELRQVRKFEQPVVVEDLSDGVNIVVGANEAGKSTLLAGLRAGLFLKHSSAAQSVTALRHHRNATAPEVALEIEREGVWRLEKRFLQGSRARLVHRQTQSPPITIAAKAQPGITARVATAPGA